MRSTLPIVLAGTVAVHVFVITLIDVASVVGKETRQKPIPRIGLVDIKVAPKKVVEPEPPKPEPTPQPPVIATPTTPPPPTQKTRTRVARTTQPIAPTEPITPPSPTDVPDPNAGGGEPTLVMPDLGPEGHGAPTAVGKPRVGGGHGGSGGGDGSGASGTGSGSGAAPLSIASIKTPAKPKGDFDYVGLGRDYPAEAKRLGIEGNLRARLVVDATGKVVSVRLLGSLGHGLDELAVSRAHKLEFEPARDTADRPVASMVVWIFTFTLPT